ncbi:YdeI/OmpD-associated family protein [Fluviicola sp.]|uniref:YdeI/OmpD-associated family protein n=1 Tax=Fluviicola sp. TaxID=1917219 RepID=UPI0031DBB35C
MTINGKEIETYCPASREAWKVWLAENHRSKQSIWLLCYKKQSNKPSITWSDAVDEALCFGWIDSTRRTVDEESFIQFFTRRKPMSTWSKINKEKVERLIAENQLTEAGFESIEIARKNGSWTILDEVEEGIIPEDLEKAFEEFSGSREFFLSLSKSVRKMLLHWIVFAKQDQTRQKRISELVEQAAQKQKPKQFR